MSRITTVAAMAALIAGATLNRESAAAVPANSATIEPTLAISIVIVRKVTQRTPNRSRTSPVRPWPVARPSRAPTSWVKNSTIWLARSTHSSS